MPWTVADVDQHKSGLTDAQKEQWVEIANSALESCLTDGGSQGDCEVAAIRQANGAVGAVDTNQQNISFLRIQANNYNIRRERHQGRWHLVVPVVMLKDGVHDGSHGPLLHLSEEYGRIPGSWDGIPVVVQHPKDSAGNYISANSPQIIDLKAVGRVYHTLCDGALKAEAWIDEEKIKKVSPLALAYIQQQRPLNVSTGLNSDYDSTPGKWNGEDYIAIARNHRPDHLALLPGGTGACSWDDGCGIRANEEKGDSDVNDKALMQTMKELGKKGFSVIQMNELGYKGICNKIQSKLDGMDTDVKYHYLDDVFSEDGRDFFVYKVSSSGEDTFYQRDYQVNDDESIEFTGEPVQVIVSKTYEPVQANTKKGGKKTMANKKGTPCCPEQVKLIIQSAHTRFEEGDREWLEGLEETSLIKLLPIPPADPPATPQVNKEQIVEVVKEQFKTTELFMSLAPAEIREQLQHGMSLHQAARAKLVEHITTNSDNSKFTAEKLESKSFEELQDLASLVKAPNDFTGNSAGNTQVNSGPKNKVLPMGMESKEDKK
ncbi:MAG: hypothetical protein V3U75_13065 [Methylococcaceae bacterium]